MMGFTAKELPSRLIICGFHYDRFKRIFISGFLEKRSPAAAWGKGACCLKDACIHINAFLPLHAPFPMGSVFGIDLF